MFEIPPIGNIEEQGRFGRNQALIDDNDTVELFGSEVRLLKLAKKTFYNLIAWVTLEVDKKALSFACTTECPNRD